MGKKIETFLKLVFWIIMCGLTAYCQDHTTGNLSYAAAFLGGISTFMIGMIVYEIVSE